MQLAHYLGVLHRTEAALAAAFGEVAEAHAGETEIFFIGQRLAQQCQQQADALAPFVQRYGEDPDATGSTRLHGPRGPGLGLLRDLQDLYLMVAESDICWRVLERAAEGVRDTELVAEGRRHHEECRVQLAWLRTQLTQASVQALVVA